GGFRWSSVAEGAQPPRRSAYLFLLCDGGARGHRNHCTAKMAALDERAGDHRLSARLRYGWSRRLYCLRWRQDPAPRISKRAAALGARGRRGTLGGTPLHHPLQIFRQTFACSERNNFGKLVGVQGAKLLL